MNKETVDWGSDIRRLQTKNKKQFILPIEKDKSFPSNFYHVVFKGSGHKDVLGNEQ